MLIKTDRLPSGLGYLEINHQACGGGLAPDGLPTVFESDTYTCTHCSCVVVLALNRERERYKCSGCRHHICDHCAALAFQGEPCKTMQQKYDEHCERVTRQLPGQPQLILPGMEL